MVNIGLIIVAVILLLAIILANFYILVYFQHEEDKNTAIFPKIIVVLGLTLVCVNILMLPMDVSNQETNGGLPMNYFWIVIYIIIAVLSIIVIPFTIFYYEAEDPDRSNTKQVSEAFKYEIVTFLLFSILTVILWIFIGVAQVPVTKLEAKFMTPNITNTGICLGCIRDSNFHVNYQVSFILYIISMLAFIGMFLFVLFGGIGLSALPIDLINAFRKRPKWLNFEQYSRIKVEIGHRASKLLEAGKELQERFARAGGRPKSRKDRRAYNKFRAAVFLLEEDYKRLEKSYEGGIGPRILTITWYWCQLILGLLGVVLSILWFIQIIVYVQIKPPASLFLNTLFIKLDNAFGLFGTIAYGLFSFYLLWCVIKGNFKFGLRIPFIFSIHPMKVGETLMSSFLFNTLLLLVASITVVQFCANAFSAYNNNTSIYVIFNVAVRYLIFFTYLWRYYFWFLFGLAFITLIYLLVFPNDRRVVEKEFAAYKTELP